MKPVLVAIEDSSERQFKRVLWIPSPQPKISATSLTGPKRVPVLLVTRLAEIRCRIRPRQSTTDGDTTPNDEVMTLEIRHETLEGEISL